MTRHRYGPAIAIGMASGFVVVALWLLWEVLAWLT